MVRADNRQSPHTLRLTVSQRDPASDAIAQATSVLRTGGLVAFPTDTLYALGADALNPVAVERVFAAKGRSLTNPIPLLVADLTMAMQLVGTLPGPAVRLAERYWPGPLTIILQAPNDISMLLTAGTGRIGLRVPDSTMALALIRHFGGPVTGTSANRSGDKDPLDAQEVVRQLENQVDLILDGGPVVGGSSSTIVDVTASPPTIVRSGPIPEENIHRLLKF